MEKAWKKILYVVVFWLTFATALAEGEWPANNRSTLTRTEDPIILKGSDLHGLLGLPEKNLRVMTVKDGKIIPVPFQIDPYDERGRMIFRKIFRNGNFIDNPKVKPLRTLARNDELVFMAGDLGDRAHAELLPAGTAVEIEVTDPLDERRGWAYVVFNSDNPPGLSDRIYLRYLADRDTVLSTSLNFGFTDPEYPAVLTFISLGDGINNAPGLVDLLDRFQMELSVTLKWGLATLVKRETDLCQAVAGYNEGPVRVTRLLRYSVLLLGSIPSPSVERLNSSYRSCISFPNDVSVPFKPGILLDDGSFDLSFDFESQTRGTRIYHALSPEPVIVDGEMDDIEKEFAKGFPLWAAMISRFGGIVGVVDVKEDLLLTPGVTKELTYLDDASLLTEGEDDPGSFGRIGWRFGGLDNLPGGNYRIDLILYGLAGHFDRGDEKQFLKIVHHPLRVDTRAPGKSSN